MRDLHAVIALALPLIPPARADLIRQLQSIRQSSLYAAPEVQPLLWRECAGALAKEIGLPAEEWELQVAAAFMGPPAGSPE